MNAAITPLISQEEIRSRLLDLSAELNHDYNGKEVLMLMVMKGAFCFAADLMRLLTFPVTIEYVSASSYGHRGKEKGELTVKGLTEISLAGKNVLIVDDIFDTGHTLHYVVSEVEKKHPRTLKTVVLLLKEHPRALAYTPDYFLFTIGDCFVVGYGMDFKEHHRQLPAICTLEAP